MKYIGVFYSYFMDTGRFKRIELESDTLEDAYKEANDIAYRQQSSFNHVKYTILEIDSNESLKQHYFKKVPAWIRFLFQL